MEDVLSMSSAVAQTETKKRIWEIDFLRGMLILLVVFDHFFTGTVSVFGNENFGVFMDFCFWYSRLSVRPAIIIIVRILFVFAAGISTQFSRNNFRRGAEVLCVAFVMTFGTWLLRVTGISPDLTIIWFGILHVLGICMMFAALFKKLQLPAIFYLSTSIPLIIAGSLFLYFKVPLETDSVILSLIFNTSLSGSVSLDFYPLLPALGIFMLGYYAGMKIYKEKRSLLPSWDSKHFSWIKFCGRHTLFFYIVPSGVIVGLLTAVKLIISA